MYVSFKKENKYEMNIKFTPQCNSKIAIISYVSYLHSRFVDAKHLG